MNGEGFETQDDFPIDGTDSSDSSEEIHLVPDDNTSHEIEGESRVADEVHKGVDDVAIPKIGMVFASVEEAYSYYNNYARMTGFSVKKRRTNKSRYDPSKVQTQSLCCSCEGFYHMVRPPKKKRKETRFGCKAMFEINLVSNGNYRLSKFIAEHNHELVSRENSHLLKSHRKLNPSQTEVINKAQTLRPKHSDIFSHLFTEGIRAQSLTSDHHNCGNAVEKSCDESIKMSDAQSLLDYFKQKKRENKHFVYSFQTNEEYKIRGVFFCDAKSRRDYGLFGDAVCFDTSFRTRDYNMVCVLIFGINSHGHTTLFGCGMLNGGTIDAFVWLFTSFLETMGGKRPNTIFTNQAMEIMNAISEVFPETHHKSYPWYIYQNATKQLAQISLEYKSFAQKFKECIYDSDTIEEFENSWNLLLEEYRLRDSEWLQGLYESRQIWAQVYGHGHFCAGMTTSQWNETVNKFFKTFFCSTLVLREFVDQYAKAIANQREKEEAENEAQQTLPILLSNWSVEREAAKTYTNNMYFFFQREYKLTLDQRLQLEKENGEIHTYKVTEREGRRRSYILAYNQSEPSVLCTCKKFELHGILCSHALKLFHHLELTSLPTQYYLKRWTKGINDEVVFDSYGEAIHGTIDPLYTARYNKLSRMAQKIVGKGAKSAEVYSFVRSGMLDLEAKMGVLFNYEVQTRIFQKNTRSNHDDSLSKSDEDGSLQDEIMKRYRAKSDSTIKNVLETKEPKKNAPSKQMGGKGGNAATQQMIGRASNPTQELLGAARHPNQVPPWQDMHPPYNLMGFPDPRYRPIVPRLNMQQASCSKAHVPPQRPVGR